MKRPNWILNGIGLIEALLLKTTKPDRKNGVKGLASKVKERETGGKEEGKGEKSRMLTAAIYKRNKSINEKGKKWLLYEQE